jgi:hypothetical protein
LRASWQVPAVFGRVGSPQHSSKQTREVVGSEPPGWIADVEHVPSIERCSHKW